MRTGRRRRSIRLPGHDYSSAGAYFLTLCTHNRECILGDVEAGVMKLTAVGVAVQDEWLHSFQVRNELASDGWVLMPNHLHAIIWIRGEGVSSVVGAHGRAPLPLHRQARSLGSFVAGFKSASTKQANVMRGTPGMPLWQRNYYERVIRSEQELHDVRRYIVDNPSCWLDDPENPSQKV